MRPILASVLVCSLGVASAQQRVRHAKKDAFLRGRPMQTRHDDPNNLQLLSDFPSLDDTIEMAALSTLIYAYKEEADDARVCDLINAGNITQDKIPASALTADLRCHWYYHDRDDVGTQVALLSSASLQYLALVFAGTDDLRTSLTDAMVLTKPFGNVNFTLPDPRPRIHAGFDNAVFANDLFATILTRWEEARANLPHDWRYFATGHSLGAANAVLAAVGMTLYYDQLDENTSAIASNYWTWPWHWHWQRRHHDRTVTDRPLIQVLNFGCPRLGNYYWNEFVHQSPVVQRLSIWRVVLGWDLVPRLPEFMYHVGHTLQLHDAGGDDANATWWNAPSNATAVAYYQHYGDADLGYAGVPTGWAAKSWFWVPGALWSHSIMRYWTFLSTWRNDTQQQDGNKSWVHRFVRIDDADIPSDDDAFPPGPEGGDGAVAAVLR